MQTARISEYRSNLSSFHKTVLEDHEPLRIIGGSRGDVVVLPAADYENLKKTIDILKDRATMNSLLESRSDPMNPQSHSKTIQEAFNDVIDGESK